MPKISVVMSIYKEPVEWMRQSIDSILNQTYSDFEFIIINDKPDRDENAHLLNEYAQKDNRIKIITNEENIGLTKSLNKGLEIAQGEYIARMDADDVSMPDRFQKQVKFLDNHPDVGVCGGWIKLFGDREGIQSYPRENLNMCLFLDSPFAHPIVMIRYKVLLDNAIRYDETCITSQDYNLWVDLFSVGVKFYNIQEPLLLYRYSDMQIMKTKSLIQIVTGKKIRHKALSVYYKMKGLEYNKEVEWSINTMNTVLRNMSEFMDKEQSAKFIYYSFLSFKKNIVWIIIKLISTGAVFKFSLLDTIRLLYFTLANRDLAKF